MTYTLGDNVRAERARAGLTQDELAERSGIGRVAIAHIEGGTTLSPGLETLRALAKGLGIPVSRLIGE